MHSQEKTPPNTLVVMVSIGNRSHLTRYTFPRLANWAASHGYSAVLLKKRHEWLDRSPHFEKLIVHKSLPAFKRYIIVDDDLLFKENAPAMESIPKGYIGLCRDAEQRHTEAPHVKWTANTGLIVVEDTELYLLEQAYQSGEYPHKCNDGSGLGIWGPYDQGIVNDVLFRTDRIHELTWKWNYQPVLDYFINRGKGWDVWRTDRLYRAGYYLSLVSPFRNRNNRMIAEAYGLHLIRGPYPSFFSRIHR